MHALILPSQLPTDLRLHFRDLDEAAVVRTDGHTCIVCNTLKRPLQNYGQIPDHMNLLSVEDAVQHVRQTFSPMTAF